MLEISLRSWKILNASVWILKRLSWDFFKRLTTIDDVVENSFRKWDIKKPIINKRTHKERKISGENIWINRAANHAYDKARPDNAIEFHSKIRFDIPTKVITRSATELKKLRISSDFIGILKRLCGRTFPETWTTTLAAISAACALFSLKDFARWSKAETSKHRTTRWRTIEANEYFKKTREIQDPNPNRNNIREREGDDQEIKPKTEEVVLEEVGLEDVETPLMLQESFINDMVELIVVPLFGSEKIIGRGDERGEWWEFEDVVVINDAVGDDIFKLIWVKIRKLRNKWG